MWVQDTPLIMPHTTRHPEFISGSHCEPSLTLLRGQMLKRVQHDEMRAEHRNVWHLHADKASTASANGVLVTNPVHQILGDPNSLG